MCKQLKKLIFLTITGMIGWTSVQANSVLNIYSARHYPSDEQLYQGFTKATGIEIRRVDADDAGILARLKAEGAQSPADVILLVDAARLSKAEESGRLKRTNGKPAIYPPMKPLGTPNSKVSCASVRAHTPTTSVCLDRCWSTWALRPLKVG